MRTEAAEEALKGIDRTRVESYEAYFNGLKPKTEDDVFRRGIFALASVHTTWELNCVLYTMLWDLKWTKDPDDLRSRIIESRAGLVNGRVKAFMQYAAMFQQFPLFFMKADGEDWYGYRDRLKDNVLGLGPAKAAFFSELVYFHDSRAVCFDTHLLQAYGIAPKDVGKVKPSERARMEVHWDMTCEKEKVNPTTARWILWDQKQRQPNSRYWSAVLEGRPTLVNHAEQLDLFSRRKAA